jgi:hypothetical protein
MQRMKSKPRMSRLAWLIVSIALVAIVVTAVLYATGKRSVTTNPSSKYSLRISGIVDKVQHAGSPVLLVLNIKNTGPAIPNYAIVFTGLQHWLVDDVTSTTVPNPKAVTPGPGYLFGPLKSGATLSVTLQISPQDIGDQTLSMVSYPNEDSYGSISASSPIDKGGAATWSATIVQ